MIRVKDPKVSLQFYQEVLGMDLIHSKRTPLQRSVAFPMTSGPAMANDAAGFTLYFLGYDHSNEEKRPEGKVSNREGMSCALCPHSGIAMTCCGRYSGTYA